MFIAVVGLSHRTAPVEIREQLSIPESQVEEAIATLCGYPHIEEATILSTCNRLEVYIVTGDMESGVRESMQFLAEFKQLNLAKIRPHLFTLLYQDAIMHLMRVAGGLDSLVLGEGQILAQVKTAQRVGQSSKGMGRILNRLFKSAITAGKRVRTDTDIGTGAVSISSAAVELMQAKQGSLIDLNIAVVGAGKMCRLLLTHLIAKKANRITVINRSLEKAQKLVSHYDVEMAVEPIEALLECVARADLVFTGTGATEPLLYRECLQPLLDGDRLISMVDISVPRNIAADVEELPNVHCYNVDDLSVVVEENRAYRLKMAEKAEAMLEEEVDTFYEWWRSLETVPTISSLRDKVETIRAQEMEKALSRLGSEFAEKHLEVIDALTRGIVNKILHDPMVQLRAQRDIEARRAAMRSLQVLFNLESQKQFRPQERS
ncbi:glutamyl-tRNA reductase [Synechococcus sp. PCC 7336]|uniref:glutamyl-tRNA reductase n=1 Tax=Synechococcus sp. PCC 7336 TaxID=195250 RepID=UPI00034D86CF|nr:glutamyl-tRNA reductase [Synechococcus sp. PCC 7336]